jgi:hypothetical protein
MLLVGGTEVKVPLATMSGVTPGIGHVLLALVTEGGAQSKYCLLPLPTKHACASRVATEFCEKHCGGTPVEDRTGSEVPLVEGSVTRLTEVTCGCT